MERRRFLQSGLAASVAGLAGCSALETSDGPGGGEADGSPVGGRTGTPTPAGADLDERWMQYQFGVGNGGHAPDNEPPPANAEARALFSKPNLYTQPTYDDGVLFVTTSVRNELFAAVDVASGEVLDTSSNLGTTDGSPGSRSRWSRSTPVVHENRAHALHSPTNTLFAWDVSDPANIELAWRAQYRGISRWNNSPVVTEETVFVVSGPYPIVEAFDAASGEKRWGMELDGDTRFPYATPALDGAGDRLFITTSRLFRDTRTTRPGRVQAISTAEQSHRWTREFDGPVRSAPTLGAGSLFVVTAAGSVVSLDPDDGDEQWTHELESDYGIFERPSVAYADGVVYAPDGDELRALDADTGDVRWRARPPESYDFFTPPVVAGGHAFVADGLLVHAFDVEREAHVWSARRPGSEKHPFILAPPAVADGRLFVAALDDNTVYEFAEPTDRRTATPTGTPGGDGIVVREDVTGDGTGDVRLRNDHVRLGLFRDGIDSGGKQVCNRAGLAGGPRVTGRIATNPKNPYSNTASDSPRFRSLAGFEVTEDTDRVGAYRVVRAYEYPHTGGKVAIDWRARLRAGDRFALARLTVTNVGGDAVSLDQDDGDIHDGLNLVNGIGLHDPGERYRWYHPGAGTVPIRKAGTWTTFDPSRWSTLFDGDRALTVALVRGDRSPKMWITEGEPAERVDLFAGEAKLSPDQSVSFDLAFGFHAGGDAAPETGKEIYGRARDRVRNG